MADTVDKITRSKIMSRIRNKETKLELSFKKLLKGHRFSYQPKIQGNPDFGIKKLKIAIFTDSCFWHKCPKHYRQPNSNKKYWIPKINRNVERAKEINRQLKKEGWKVIRLWEHDIKKNPKRCINKINSIYKD